MTAKINTANPPTPYVKVLRFSSTKRSVFVYTSYVEQGIVFGLGLLRHGLSFSVHLRPRMGKMEIRIMVLEHLHLHHFKTTRFGFDLRRRSELCSGTTVAGRPTCSTRCIICATPRVISTPLTARTSHTASSFMLIRARLRHDQQEKGQRAVERGVKRCFAATKSVRPLGITWAVSLR